jgi:hypothetical protein
MLSYSTRQPLSSRLSVGLYHFPRSGKLIEPQRRRGERNDLGE